MTNTVFNASTEDFRYIRIIADRAMSAELYQSKFNETIQDAMMDLEAVHCNGCPLDLQALAHAAPAHFNHDICGIKRNLDRSTGKLIGHWTPRHKKVQVSA